MTAIQDPPVTQLTAQEQEWVDQFMDETTLFLGPDPAIMRDHSITPRSDFENYCISTGVDPLQIDRIRKRLAGALDEGYEMCEAHGRGARRQMGRPDHGHLHGGRRCHLPVLPRGDRLLRDPAPPDPVHHEVLEGRADRRHQSR